MSGSNRKCPITDDGKTRATDNQCMMMMMQLIADGDEVRHRQVEFTRDIGECQSMQTSVINGGQGTCYLEVDPQLSAA